MVTTTVDGNDAVVGDGTCEMTVGVGDCSLRAAVDEANASLAPDPPRIVVPSATYPLTDVGDDDANEGGDLDIEPHGRVVIEAEAPGAVIDGAGAAGGLDVRGGLIVVRGVAITNTSGQAVHVRSGIVRLDGSSIHGNAGAGLVVDADAVALTINTTISQNSPGVVNAGLYAAHFTTISGNTGSGIGGTGSTAVAATVIAAQATGPDCTGVIASDGYNLDSDGTCGLASATDQPAVDPLLGSLAGHPLPAFQPGAPITDVVPVGVAGLCDTTYPVDQWGTPRPRATGCDAGAIEATNTFTVDNPADAHDDEIGDRICDIGDGTCTLRAAIDETNADGTAGNQTIVLAVDPTLSLTGPSDDTNGVGDLDISTNLTIEGQEHTLDAAGIDRAIHHRAGTLAIDQLVITGGNALPTSGGGGPTTTTSTTTGTGPTTSVVGPTTTTTPSGGGSAAGSGGAILQEAGHLSITASTLVENDAATSGGALYQVAGTATVAGTSIESNTSDLSGGAIHQSLGDLVLTDSEVTANDADGALSRGGGIAHDGGTLAIVDTAVTGNVSSVGGGIDHDAGSLDVVGSTVADNAVTWDGAGIRIHGAETMILRSSVTGNVATDSGGGIEVHAGTTVSITASTIDSNTAAQGGGIHASGGVLVVTNTTLTGNAAGTRGGAINATAGTSIEVRSSTITANTSPTGIAVAGEFVLRGSIVAGSSKACSAPVDTQGHNIDSDGTCGLVQPTDHPGAGSTVLPLADNGGPTATLLLVGGSPAVDAIPVGTPDLCDSSAVADQRGFPRPSGAACDIGAVEGDDGSVSSPLALIVDTPLDAPDAAPGDGVCDVGGGACSLRAAVSESNLHPAGSVVTIAPGVDPVLSLAGTFEDGNATGDLDIIGTMILEGQDATIDANGLDRAIDHRSGSLVVRQVTVTGGANGDGAGIRHWAGGLRLDHVVIDANSGELADRGGGLLVEAGTVVMTDSTVSNNTVTGKGGGIYFLDGSMWIDASQVSDNQAHLSSSAAGGGIYQLRGTLLITDTTVEDNTVDQSGEEGGGIGQFDGELALRGAVVRGNEAPAGGGISTWISGVVHIDDSLIASNTAANPHAEGGGLQVLGLAAVTDSTITANRSIGSFADGGGIHSSGQGLTVSTSTISNNMATVRGGGIAQESDTVIVASTIVANTAPQGNQLYRSTGGHDVMLLGNAVAGAGIDCIGQSGSEGYNLDSDDTCGFSEPTDQPATPALLGALTDNGGPTPTRLPSSDSPLIDAIPVGTAGLCDATVSADQRGSVRPAGAACDIGSVEGSGPPSEPLTLTVDTSTDGSDANLGDGVCDDGLGGCTLRAAIDEASGALSSTEITIAAGVDPVLSHSGSGEDVNATGDLDVRSDLTVHGAGAVIHADGIDRVFHLLDGELVLSDLTITGGQIAPEGFESGGGGILQDRGRLILDHVTVSGNQSNGEVGVGAGIYQDAGILEVVDSTIVGNSAEELGGGIHQDGGSGTIDRSNISNNQAWGGNGLGGGISQAVAGTLTVTNSTVSANTATDGGGGIRARGTTEVTASTVVSNTGGSLRRDSGALSVHGSILGGPGTDCVGDVVSLGFNIDTDGSCDLLLPSDLPSSNPAVGSLGDHGGPTATRLPLAGSPAIDAVPVGTPQLCDGGVAVDQRGVARPDGSACDIGSVEGLDPASAPLDLVVDTAADGVDSSPGDGSCDVDGAPAEPGDCSLRAAIQETEATGTTDRIAIAPGIDPVLTLVGANENVGASGDLDIEGHLVIDGGGATVSAGGVDRVFHQLGGNLTLSALTITGGSTPGVYGLGVRVEAGALLMQQATVSGHVAGTSAVSVHTGVVDVSQSSISGNGTAGLHSDGGTIDIASSEISDNQAPSGGGLLITNGSPTITISASTITGNRALGVDGYTGNGAGILIDGGTLSISSSTISGNHAVNGSGGAIFVLANEEAVPSVTTRNTTISGNRADQTGGAVFVGPFGESAGTTSLLATSIVDNTAPTGGSLRLLSSSIVLRGSVIQGSAGACSGAITSAGYNVASDASCGLTDPSDLPSTDAVLGPLADNGGPTRTHLLYANSPARDSIPGATVGLCEPPASDQRGLARPEGVACDRGAVEGHNGVVAVTALSLIVDSAADGVDLVPGDGTCATAGGSCSLRAAIDESNAWPFADTITIAPGIDPVLSIVGADDDDNETGDLDLRDSVTIDGQGATVDANAIDRVVDIAAGATVLDDLVIAGGASTAGGGGILHRFGTLSLSSSTIGSNTVSATAVGGAGLYLESGAVTITDSLITANVATGSTAIPLGGGIYQAQGTLTVLRSTVSANVATAPVIGAHGGGIYQAAGTATVTLSTISGNRAAGSFATVGGGVYSRATMTIALSTIKGNTAAFSAGLQRGAGSLKVKGSILDNSGKSCSVGIVSNGYNLVADATCAFVSTGDVQSTDPLLGALADNGGPTPTHLPGGGSLAIHTIPAGTVGLCDGAVAVDQRGIARPQGAGCDKGAVEQ